MDNGKIEKSSTKSKCLKMHARKWNNLKLMVEKKCSKCKNVKAFIDNRWVGSFEAYFQTRGEGGVLVENGFNNIAEFRNFDIAPIIPDLSSNQLIIENFL